MFPAFRGSGNDQDNVVRGIIELEDKNIQLRQLRNDPTTQAGFKTILNDQIARNIRLIKSNEEELRADGLRKLQRKRDKRSRGN